MKNSTGNKGIDLFNGIIDAVLYYEQESDCVERNEKGGGVMYSKLITLGVNKSMYDSLLHDLKNLNEGVNMEDATYKGFYFSIKIKE